LYIIIFVFEYEKTLRDDVINLSTHIGLDYVIGRMSLDIDYA